MSTHRATLCLIVALCVASGCTESEGRLEVSRPTGFGISTAPFVGVNTSVVTAQSVIDPLCPGIPPFVANINLTIGSTGDFGVSVRSVRMQFVDFRTGLSAPQVTLPAPIPIAQAGSTLVQARDQRTFPFVFPFGCGTGRRGTIVIIVDTQTDRGVLATNQLKVEVR
jgi:hypothetical protein